VQDVLSANGYSGGLALVAHGTSGDPFYTFRNGDGALCLATGGAALCPNQGKALLGSLPIADFVGVKDAGSGSLQVTWWRGMTSSNVASVDLLDSDGQTHSSSVVNGAFDVEGPFVSPARYEARDVNGVVVWSRDG
jgi:hypothetical protein